MKNAAKVYNNVAIKVTAFKAFEILALIEIAAKLKAAKVPG
jgi:hypothetical protein